MTTKRRPKGATLSPSQHLGIDLATFCAQIDEYTGRPEGTVEQAVRDYREGSDITALTGSQSVARKAVEAKLDQLINSGMGVVNTRPIRKVTRSGGSRITVRSAAVQKALPELWADSRVTSRALAITSLTPRQLQVPRINLAPEAWRFLEQLKTSHAAASAKVNLAREVLRAVADEVTPIWPGDVRLTTDGWTLGWTFQSRFNEARCRELATERGIDLSGVEEAAISAGRTSYVLVDADPNGPDYCAN